MTLTEHTDKIWAIKTFLTPQACAALIKRSEKTGFSEATVSLPEGAQMIKGLRNNDRLVFEDLAFAISLFENLQPLLPVFDPAWQATRLHERLRVYRYDKSQRFKRHIDGRVKVDCLESRVTFMVYLNSGFEGGETKFNDVTILPETGMALLFVHEQKHESLPILSGRKYVLRSDILYRKPLTGDTA